MTGFAAYLPLALVEDGRRLSWALGEAPDAVSDFSVPVAAAETPAVLVGYGLNANPVGDGFLALLNDAAGGTLPAEIDWVAHGLSPAQVAAVIAGLTCRVYDPLGGEQFTAMLAEHGLVRQTG